MDLKLLNVWLETIRQPYPFYARAVCAMAHWTGVSWPSFIANRDIAGTMSSLLPLLLELDAPRRPHQHVSLALAPDEVFGVFSQTRDYNRSWQQLSRMLLESSSTIKADKNKFQINLDVLHFAPEEITVKTCDGFVVVEGKHEEKRDELGWVSRQFRRRYELPAGCSAEAVQSRLSSDGVLTVTAPLPTQAPDERLVPMVHTGPVRTQIQPESTWGLLGDGEAPEVLNTPVENGQ